MKNKAVDYLPLKWAKKAVKLDIGGAFAKDSEWYRDLLLRCVNEGDTMDVDAWFELYKPFLSKHTELNKLLKDVVLYCKIKDDATLFGETLQDYNSESLIMLWSRDKQVFKIDRDFADELLDTDNLCVPVDAFDHLPFKYFYVDLSDCTEVCDKTLCGGFFCTVQKVNREGVSSYVITTTRVTDEVFCTDMQMIANDGVSVEATIYDDKVMMEIITDGMDTNGKLSLNKTHKEFNLRLFNTLVIQLLLYLSSVKPDVVENKESQQTYRKPANGVIKNRYSEIFTWDVGVRFGNSVRDWKKKSSHSSHGTGVSTGAGTAKRPHMRRAHWHTYLYNAKDGTKERRLKWIEPIFVNEKFVESKDEVPVTIHETKLFS